VTARVRVGLPAVLAIVALGIACAARRAPDPRPAPAPKLAARLDHFPPIGIAGQVFTLHAVLDDPQGTVHCPTVTWTWPNGTRSSHTSDCDPDERVTRHSDLQRGRLGSGEHHFAVTFDSEGHAWSAETVVEVH
jgi:hypothetical protein